jgi:signal peptide peptidase SppA
MSDAQRTAARGVLTRAAEAGVPPLLLSGSPWAIRKDLLARVVEAARFPEAASFAVNAAARRTTTESDQPVGKVAVIPLTGIITPQGSFFDFLFGGAPGGLVGFRAAFDEALHSPEVEAIVIDVDSPGGLIDLVPETAQHIRDARGSKPIVAIADTLMASAAYWIGAQADELVITPSGYAGSIGVYRMHIDESALNEKIGIDVTYIHAGRYKVDGNPDEPLSDDARADWQQNVDDAYAAFVDDVAAGRGTTAENVISTNGEGRVLHARRALEAGLVDRVETYEATVSRLLGAGATSMSTAALAAQLERLQQALLEQQISAQNLTAEQLRGLLNLVEPEQPTTPPEPEPEPEATTPWTEDERAAAAAQLLAG